MAELLRPLADGLGRRARLARLPRAHPSRRGLRAVRRHAVRAALEPRRQRRQRAPRRGRARDVAGPVAGPRGRGRADHARHQRRPHPDLDRRADARPARPPPRRGLGRPRHRSRDLGRRRLAAGGGAVGGAQRAAPDADRPRARAQRDRPPRARRHAGVRARGGGGARPRGADDRLRAPRRDLQAARPAAQRRRPRARAARRRRPPRAADPGRQGAPEGRRGQAARPAPVRDEVAPRGRPPRRLPRRLRLQARRRDDARLRRLGQRPAPAARGERDERHQVGDQRRAAALRARRLVARGLRRLQRLGDQRRGRPRPRRAGLAPRRGALPARDRRGHPGLLRARRRRAARRRGWRWSGPRCARAGRASGRAG